MRPDTHIIEADFTWVDGRFTPCTRVEVDAKGVIRDVRVGGVGATRRLTQRALLPGFVNVHSHAFQRALRGRGEAFPQGQGDFWTWRLAMYELVESLDADEFARIGRLAFTEMLAAGITTVGEFHYLHHDAPNADNYVFDDLVLEAAADVGIRLVLLLCYYRTGGIGKPLLGGQRHFESTAVDGFLRQLDHVQSRLDPRTQSIGIAPHSIRAVPTSDLLALRRAAAERGLVFHMHVEEQRREIEECRGALGVTPLGWMLAHLSIDDTCTIVHATHSQRDEMARYVAAGGRVCVCPITEGNLGDGVAAHMPETLKTHDAVCVGSDSNIRIDFAEELRWLEFAHRLREERRGVFADPPEGVVGRRLLHIGTRAGAAALGLNTGAIETGRAADFFTLDLTHPTLVGWTPETLLDAYLFGSGREAVREVCVAGRWVR